MRLQTKFVKHILKRCFHNRSLLIYPESRAFNRKYASFSEFLSKTETTTLNNGFTVASESIPYAQTATVGVWIDSGSRSESSESNGVAHFLEHLAFKGTKSRTQQQLELEIENMGAHLNAYTSREQTVYYAKSFRDDVPKVVDILADILQNSKFETSAIDRERDVILREQEEVDKQTEEVVFDHLHATAYQGHPLGCTILGPKENILSIKHQHLISYINENYTADRMVLVGAGGVLHEQLVELAEKYFSNLPTSPNPVDIGSSRGSAPKFVGSEIRIRDDTSPTANIAIAVEGVPWRHPDYWTMLVMQAIVGNWDRTLGSASHLSSKLSGIVSKHNLANSFMSFSTSYSDTGLWGIYLVSENLTCLDDLVHFALKEWSRLSLSVTKPEVERAKAQLKASLLLGLDGTTAVAEDIGRQIVTCGRRMTPYEIDKHISKITEKDIQRVAQSKLWDADIAISAVGSIEGLLDYNRICANMSLNRW
ncbi:hypothetical protein PORY_000870 [Pneumocystis oryctolagi]|uniref:Uncharacterized protein n=1 Tax=Pneumocystis oryctolagi TaxID=42067 RepID=A0ACB7CEL5_9ASCO|nr:hypothetical protein PORY_000870 [Pneumocystis oryctolagi]